MTAAVARAPYSVSPVSIRGVTGYPYPDSAYDPCPVKDWHGWLPWGVVQVDRGWYIGLYSCDRGHTWACWYALVAPADDPAFRELKVSPVMALPSRDELHAAGAWPLPGPITVVDWGRSR